MSINILKKINIRDFAFRKKTRFEQDKLLSVIITIITKIKNLDRYSNILFFNYLSKVRIRSMRQACKQNDIPKKYTINR